MTRKPTKKHVERVHPWLFDAEIEELVNSKGERRRTVVSRAGARKGRPFGRAIRATKTPAAARSIAAVEKYLNDRSELIRSRLAVQAEALRKGMPVTRGPLPAVAPKRGAQALEELKPWMLQAEIDEYASTDSRQRTRLLTRAKRRRAMPYGAALLATETPTDPESVRVVRAFIGSQSNHFSTREIVRAEALRKGMNLAGARMPPSVASERAAARRPKGTPVHLMTDEEITRRAQNGEGDKDRLWREARFRKWTRKQMIAAFE